MSDPKGRDIGLDAVCCQFQPYLTVSCVLESPCVVCVPWDAGHIQIMTMTA